MKPPWRLELGATVEPGGATTFRVWAPDRERLSLELFQDPRRVIPMERGPSDVFQATVGDARPGTDYAFVLDGDRERPDPVSRSQPHGVHGPSRIVDPSSFRWTDAGWTGRPIEELMFYELHVGAFTAEGTFDAIIPRLDDLVDLGVTAVELMPVAAFPGTRNWGYDGVHLYAPQASYGGPEGLKRLVDACHARGLAFVLDVVYNHLGPEGNYLREFGPYFTDRYRSPWGDALNFDGPGSDGVRRHMIDNALHWLTEYHVDALRLDAIHAIYDLGACHLLRELARAFAAEAARLGRQAWLIAESDLDDTRVIDPPERGGHGIDAQWLDDFHHALHARVTGRSEGFLEDFGKVEDLLKAIRFGYVYDGLYSAHRQRRHGNSSAANPGRQFVVFHQNHDQVANTCQGLRLGALAGLDRQRVSACLMLTAPYLPLLFMGEEYADPAPFHFFTDFGDPDLAAAVSRGRREEHTHFLRAATTFHDPQDPDTLRVSRLDWDRRSRSHHRGMLDLYRDLIALRRIHPALAHLDRELTRVEGSEPGRWICMVRASRDGHRVMVAANLGETAHEIPVPAGTGWRLRLWTADPRYGATDPHPPPPPPARIAPDPSPGPPLRLAGWTAAIYED